MNMQQKKVNEFERLLAKYRAQDMEDISQITLPDMCEEHVKAKWPDTPWRVIKPFFNEEPQKDLEEVVQLLTSSFEFEKNEVSRVLCELRTEISSFNQLLQQQKAKTKILRTKLKKAKKSKLMKTRPPRAEIIVENKDLDPQNSNQTRVNKKSKKQTRRCIKRLGARYKAAQTFDENDVFLETTVKYDDSTCADSSTQTEKKKRGVWSFIKRLFQRKKQ